MKKSLFIVILLACVSVIFTSARKRPVTLFLVGDSTMADKTELDISPERGWGQLFPSYLKGNIEVQNHAKNGRSTKSFQDEGRWDEVLRRMQKGDIVIIQFGHNDAKVADPARYSSVEDYEKNLTKMVQEAQQKKVKVILCTSICRRNFNDKGEFYYDHGGYPAGARRVAKAMNVPLLDMEALTGEWLKSLGDEASKPYYMNVAAGECQKFPEGKVDNTHLREAGALVVGRMVVEQILAQNIKCLKKYIRIPEQVEPKYTTLCGIK